MESQSMFEEIAAEEFYGEPEEIFTDLFQTISLSDDETPEFLKAA